MFKARVERGKVLGLDRDRLGALLSTLEGRDIEIVVRPRRERRTTKQNRFWRALVDLAAAEIGCAHGEAHYAMLGEYFGWMWATAVDETTGEEVVLLVPRVGHSAPLTMQQFTGLLEWALWWLPNFLKVQVPAHANDYDDGELP